MKSSQFVTKQMPDSTFKCNVPLPQNFAGQ